MAKKKKAKKPAKRHSRPDPEEAIFKRMPGGWDKGRKVATAKSQGMVKQAGRHLEPTAKGKAAIKKIKGRRT